MPASDLLIGLGGLFLLMLPGWLVARSRGLPLPSLVGFISGAVGLVLLVQGIDALGLGLSIATLIPAWLALSLISVLVALRFRTKGKQAPSDLHRERDWLLALPLIPAIAVVAYRAIAQSLFGVDNIFRWNFLAEQISLRHTLAFYPPVTAADYSIYAWPDGFAPIVSTLYFWAYNLAGAARPILTAPVVIAQFLLLLFAIYECGRRLCSPRAGALACALAACSPVLLWSVAMGQESGLLALSLLGVLIYFPASRESAGVETTIMAGIAAGMGGLAREYGLAFILFGLSLGMFRRLRSGTLMIFLLTSLVCVVPWYGRNWLHTGNPLFNFDLAGLFPVNGAALRLMHIIEQAFGWDKLPSTAAQIFLANCPVFILSLIAGLVVCFKRSRCLFMAVAMVAILWAVALSYTAAGFTYSLRVLVPAMAVTAVMGGMAAARWVPHRTHLAGVTLALFIFAMDASLRALVLPSNIYKIPPQNWLSVGGAVHEFHRRPVYQQLANYAGGRPILILGPASLLNRFGAQTIPIWSPGVSFLWDESLTKETAAQTLMHKGINLFLVSKGEENQAYLAQIAFFRHERSSYLQSIWEDDEMTLFQIRAPQPATQL